MLLILEADVTTTMRLPINEYFHFFLFVVPVLHQVPQVKKMRSLVMVMVVMCETMREESLGYDRDGLLFEHRTEH